MLLLHVILVVFFFVFLGLAGTDTTVQSVVCGVFSAISYVISFSNSNISSDAQAYMLCTLVAGGYKLAQPFPGKLL
jgi:hypothetical protein